MTSPTGNLNLYYQSRIACGFIRNNPMPSTHHSQTPFTSKKTKSKSQETNSYITYLHQNLTARGARRGAGSPGPRGITSSGLTNDSAG
jgi:hypothetical protein